MTTGRLERGTAGSPSPWRAQRARRQRLVARASLLGALALVVPRPARAAAGNDVHHPGGDCGVCHTADAGLLAAHGDAAATTLVPNLETVCNGCHAEEGPSHRTGVAPRRPVPASLPLAPDGTITCATCHFVHGEATGATSFERIDNRHGELCLTCHELAELE